MVHPALGKKKKLKNDITHKNKNFNENLFKYYTSKHFFCRV